MMNKKRGWLSLVLVVVLLVCSLGVFGQSIVISNADVTSYPALVVVGEDDGGCDPGSAIPSTDTPKSGKTLPDAFGKSKDLWWVEDDDILYNVGGSYEYSQYAGFTITQKEDQLTVTMPNDKIECTWSDLKLSETGCYIFAQEQDVEYLVEETDNEDDCAGALLKSSFHFLDQNGVKIGEKEGNIEKLIPPDEGFDGKDAQNTIFDCDTFKTPADFSLICADRYFNYVSEGKTYTNQPKKVWLECSEKWKDKYVKVTLKPEDDGVVPEPELTGGDIYQCQDVNGQYKWMNIKVSKGGCDLPEIDCNKNKVVCEANKFSHITTSDGGKCCGLNGVSDLGDLESSDAGKNYICLNRNMVGADGGKVDTKLSKDWTKDNSCSDDWCWVPADINAMFHILTIRKPGAPPYDVVSNSKSWFACDKDYKFDDKNPGRLKPPVGTTTYDSEVNRFYCYQEGNHWSWAECPGGSSDLGYNKGTIKVRNAGEGLYNLYLDNAKIEDSGTLKERIAYGHKVTISVDKDEYEHFYKETFFDFSGYSDLNFMVKFAKDEKGTPYPIDELELPLDVSLKIYGPKQDGDYISYFEENVLSYAVNNPSLGEDWVHVKVPINNFKGISLIEIESTQPDFNEIVVKNVYLSKTGEKTMLCSGEDVINVKFSSWLTDMDQSVDGNPITGEKLCNSWYGDNAWLGHSGKDEVDKPSASCCGNDKNEYYAGESAASKDTTGGSTTLGEKYGCWNSQPVASGDPIMNVEFQIDYREEAISVDYPEEDFTYFVTQKNAFTPPPDSDIEPCPDDITKECYVFDCVDKSCQVAPKPYDYAFVGGTFKLDFVNSPKKLTKDGLLVKKSDFRRKTIDIIEKISIDTKNDKIDVYFYNSLTGFEDDEITATALSTEDNIFHIMAKVNDNYEIKTTPVPVARKLGDFPKTITYSCSEDECIFPLPGLPPYEITNPYPSLYELYFVSEGDKEYLIDEPKEKFKVEGNLRAKKIAQQVIFVSQEEDKSKGIELEREFYGCQAASFIESLIDSDGKPVITNLPYCSIKEDKFCSHNSSWSDDGITRVGYEELPSGDTTVPDTFTLKDITGEEISKANKRNQSTSVVPGRNFIPNAEFDTIGKDIPYWRIDITHAHSMEVVPAESTANKESSFLVGDNKMSVVLGADQYLTSEKIAIKGNLRESLDLSFSQKGTLVPTISLIDKDGKETTVPAGSLAKFNIKENVFLVLKFTGPGTIEKPMLQVVDDLGIADYDYLPTDETNRAGAACCPENYCWNGYVCVKDMSGSDYLFEKISKGREYRCIQGQWRYLPMLWDWNFDAKNRGYCDKENQCLVLSKLNGGDAANKAKDFYDGNIPVCVDDKEQIFDHHCDQGTWTSRTKVLANQLIEFAEQDNYVLYCTDYQNALVDYQYQESYLSGDNPDTVKDTTGSGVLIGQTQTKTINVCFSGLIGDKYKTLLSPKKNTCINNVCVLKAKQGGSFKTAFATTLNKDLNDKNSFLLAMNVNPSNVNCPTGTGFVKCTGVSGDLWYSKELNAVIYSKDGISIKGTIRGRLKSWFLGFFTDKSKEKSVVEEATAFNELYLLKKDDKKISVIREAFPGKEVLVAEYENFKTPVCDYVKNINSPGKGLEILEEHTGKTNIDCIKTDDIQKVIITDSLDFWWPQLTGMLRVNE